VTFGKAGVGIRHVHDFNYKFVKIQSIDTVMLDDLLTSACVSADNYDSASTQKSIEARFKAAFGGKTQGIRVEIICDALLPPNELP
jgi:hypothetical protein